MIRYSAYRIWMYKVRSIKISYLLQYMTQTQYHMNAWCYIRIMSYLYQQFRHAPPRINAHSNTSLHGKLYDIHTHLVYTWHIFSYIYIILHNHHSITPSAHSPHLHPPTHPRHTLFRTRQNSYLRAKPLLSSIWLRSKLKWWTASLHNPKEDIVAEYIKLTYH